ncbi:MAG: type IV pilus twitching motility protein PilT, partial [Persicimonas sp.]
MPEEYELPKILQIAVKGNASDIHIKAGLPPIFRVDGSLVPLRNAKRLSPEDIGKMAAAIMSKYQKEEFEETLDLDMSHGVPGVGRFRVNIFQQRGSIGLVFRVIPFKVLSPDELSLPAVVQEIAQERRGLVLVTGATGSGKSTTLASILDHINRVRTDHIVTIEDPIEYLI